MPSQSHPSIRPPAAAGRFYPADPDQCRHLAQSYLIPAPTTLQQPIAGLVPHAGWICSGAIAGQTIATLAAAHAASPPDIVVVFGAIHTPLRVHFAALDSHLRWAVPGGESSLPLEAESKLLETPDLFQTEPRLHDREHAVEVNLPLLQLAFPNATILPIETPPLELAQMIGRKTAQVLRGLNLRAVYLASSDLTHYGPNYRFTPVGVGESAMAWTLANDQRLLDLIGQGKIEEIIPEVRQRQNACGAGAIVAMLSAAREHGASGGEILTHATSYQTLAKVAPQPPSHAVGYASLVVG